MKAVDTALTGVKWQLLHIVEHNFVVCLQFCACEKPQAHLVHGCSGNIHAFNAHKTTRDKLQAVFWNVQHLQLHHRRLFNLIADTALALPRIVDADFLCC